MLLNADNIDEVARIPDALITLYAYLDRAWRDTRNHSTLVHRWRHR
jgi:hypothetical protein